MKLTKPQRIALFSAEPTLFGEQKVVHCHGNTANKMRDIGLVQGVSPHIYLTSIGKAALEEMINAEKANSATD